MDDNFRFKHSFEVKAYDETRFLRNDPKHDNLVKNFDVLFTEKQVILVFD